MTVKIDKDIPMPAASRRNGAELYPWADMVVGDSFLFSGTEHNANSHCTAKGNKYGMKFSYRKVAGKIRIWRTK